MFFINCASNSSKPPARKETHLRLFSGKIVEELFHLKEKFMNPNFNSDVEIIDLEQAAKNGQQAPKGKKNRILVNQKPLVVEKDRMTGEEILSAAGLNPPNRHQLRMKVRGTWITVNYEQEIDFTAPGIEKFKTLPLDQTEGEVPRRDFTLLEEDVEFLESLGLKWEAIILNQMQWVLIHLYTVPKGYNVEEVLIAVQIRPGYPTAALDMLYFFPALQRVDRQPINALAMMNIDGKEFQRWSRHRSGANPWRPGVDNLGTHVPLADVWLNQEFQKRPAHAVSA